MKKVSQRTVNKCNNFAQLVEVMGLPNGGYGYRKARAFVQENNINISHFPKSKRTSDLNIMECNSFADVVRALGLPDGGWGYAKAKEYVRVHNLDTSHF